MLQQKRLRRKQNGADHETAVAAIYVDNVCLGRPLERLATLPHEQDARLLPFQRCVPKLQSSHPPTPARGERRQHDTSLRIHQKLKPIIITVKMQLGLSWEHLISLWKWKFYVNQMAAWPCARSQGGCAILHSNELPQKTQQLHQTGLKHNIAQKSEAHAAYFRVAFIFYPMHSTKGY